MRTTAPPSNGVVLESSPARKVIRTAPPTRRPSSAASAIMAAPPTQPNFATTMKWTPKTTHPAKWETPVTTIGSCPPKTPWIACSPTESLSEDSLRIFIIAPRNSQAYQPFRLGFRPLMMGVKSRA